MAMTAAEFWGVNYYKHPPLTPKMLAYAEDSLEVKLPPLLVELLLFQNGGYTMGFGFPMNQPTSWASDHVPLDDMAGIVIDSNIKTAFNMLESDYMIKEWGLPPKQVLLTGDGHWWVTLDYRAGDIPSVLWADVEMNEFVPVAPTFEAFFEGLRPSAEFD